MRTHDTTLGTGTLSPLPTAHTKANMDMEEETLPKAESEYLPNYNQILHNKVGISVVYTHFTKHREVK